MAQPQCLCIYSWEICRGWSQVIGNGTRQETQYLAHGRQVFYHRTHNLMSWFIRAFCLISSPLCIGKHSVQTQNWHPASSSFPISLAVSIFNFSTFNIQSCFCFARSLPPKFETLGRKSFWNETNRGYILSMRELFHVIQYDSPVKWEIGTLVNLWQLANCHLYNYKLETNTFPERV